MHLAEFRVQNYKIIQDTGWVPVDRLTIFVGKNESGKSAIFRALSKMNPSDGAGYDGLKEFPRQRYASEITRTDWPVASCRFVLNDKERQDLAGISELCQDVQSVEVTRHYTGRYGITYHPDIGIDLITSKELIHTIEVAVEQIRNLSAPEGRGETLGRIKETLLIFLEEQKTAIPEEGQIQRRQVTDLINALKSRANEPWQQEILSPITEPFYRLNRQIEIYESLMTANRYIIDHLPKFLYFDQYSVIESAIHIPTFIATLKSHPDSPGLRATNCLFRHVNLDLDLLDKLGSHKNATDDNPIIRRQVDERSILLSTASNLMTKKFENWWEQRRIRFRYDIDGDYFRVWVSDDLDPSEIELEQRSAGLQYFFSFYLIFLVESGDAYHDCILLLDEPGIELHATSQLHSVKFFEQLSQKNQIMYSTHSPFMIDLDHPERVRTVFESEDGTTKVSVRDWPKDRDSLFPLEAALAYRIAQKILVTGKQVLVEDLADLWILQAMNYVLLKQEKGGINPAITLTPAGGIINLIPLATLIKAGRHQAVVLLSGKEIPREMLDHTQADGIKRTILLYNQFTPVREATVEDLISSDLYRSCVTEISSGLASGLITPPSSDGFQEQGILSRIEDVIEQRRGERFERWKVAELLADRICEAPGTVDEETVAQFSRLFSELNRLCGETDI
jgi:predicted ATPase